MIICKGVNYCLLCCYRKGCLAPVEILVPSGSILDPSDKAAVVGGNVLTSQRVVDVVLKAFRVCAASQGCMNNITFGNDAWGNYETVAGGSGAVSVFLEIVLHIIISLLLKIHDSFIITPCGKVQ